MRMHHTTSVRRTNSKDVIFIYNYYIIHHPFSTPNKDLIMMGRRQAKLDRLKSCLTTSSLAKPTT